MSNPYSADYYQQAKNRYALKSWLRAQLQTWLRPTALKRLVDALPQGGSVLDIGCGQGELLSKLAQLRPDLQLWGADFTTAEPLAGFHFVNADAGRLPFPAANFDLIISKQLLEHLDDTGPLLREVVRVLRPGGHFYLDCPDARGASSWSRPNFWDDPTHVRPYTRTALRRLFDLYGLEVPRTGRVRDWRVALLGVFYLPIAALAKDRLFLPGWLGNVFGLWIYAVGRKPGAD